MIARAHFLSCACHILRHCFVLCWPIKPLYFQAVSLPWPVSRKFKPCNCPKNVCGLVCVTVEPCPENYRRESLVAWTDLFQAAPLCFQCVHRLRKTAMPMSAPCTRRSLRVCGTVYFLNASARCFCLSFIVNMCCLHVHGGVDDRSPMYPSENFWRNSFFFFLSDFDSLPAIPKCVAVQPAVWQYCGWNRLMQGSCLLYFHLIGLDYKMSFCITGHCAHHG